jgi:hypothetical protein
VQPSRGQLALTTTAGNDIGKRCSCHKRSRGTIANSGVDGRWEENTRAVKMAHDSLLSLGARLRREQGTTLNQGPTC